MARAVEADLIRFRDVQQLKWSLQYYQIESSDDDDWAMRPDDYRPRHRRRRQR